MTEAKTPLEAIAETAYDGISQQAGCLLVNMLYENSHC
jgi:hypothetical protein